MGTNIINDLRLQVGENLNLVGHYNLDKDSDCFVISYHVDDAANPSEPYIPTRYFLRRVDGQWVNGNYENDNRFEPVKDPYVDHIQSYLLKTYY